MNSVLQDWVMELPLREQGTLLTCVRGCDLTPKFPLDSLERHLVGAIRCAFLNPADPREIGITGAFFVREPPHPGTWKASELGHYPLHWFAHIMHGCEVLGYRHPDLEQRAVWYKIYCKLATSLHLNIETWTEMIDRLSEDRIAKGEVVS